MARKKKVQYPDSDWRSTDQLTQELEKIKLELTQAYSDFNNSLEPELIEASVWEINALQARYGYLYRTVRGRGAEPGLRFRFPESDAT